MVVVVEVVVEARSLGLAGLYSAVTATTVATCVILPEPWQTLTGREPGRV